MLHVKCRNWPPTSDSYACLHRSHFICSFYYQIQNTVFNVFWSLQCDSDYLQLCATWCPADNQTVRTKCVVVLKKILTQSVLFVLLGILHLSCGTNFLIPFGSLISLVHLSAPLCPQAPTPNLLSTCLMVCSILGSRPISFPSPFLPSRSPLSHGLIIW